MMFSFPCLLPAEVGSAPAYDVVIRGGRVVDGTGAPAFCADVGIRRQRVAAVGKSLGTGRQELDATGCAVAPGFIDVHTHGEGIEKLPLAENFVRQGVTTIILGNCGESAPDIGAFFRRLEKNHICPNVASLVGHGTIREQAMGGSFNRPPTDTEMQRMRELVHRAMKAGALGLSTGLIYQPSCYATTNELVQIARVVAAYDGIYTSHMRSESDEIIAALEEVFRIAREAGIRCEVSHIKLSGQNNWGRALEVLAAIESARRQGLDITQDQYFYTASSTTLSQLVPMWAQEGGIEAFQRRVAYSGQRKRMVEEMKAALQRRRQEDYGWVRIASCNMDPSLNGLALPDAARKRSGRDDLDSQIALVLEIHAAGGAAAVFHGISEDDLQVFLRHPNTMAGSDSGVREFGKDVPHPRGYGNHVRLLARYVRELEVLRLEEAVRRMTSLPASVFRLRDRGLLRPGNWADVVVFDPNRVADRATFEQPHQYPDGIRHVLINGEPVIREEKLTGTLPGRLLRHKPPR